MSQVRAALRRRVILRADNRCEYCRLSQIGQEAAFHLDHIKPQTDGGRSTAANLALACVSCSLRKESRRSAVDPQIRRRVPLFHPRRQSWNDHFRWEGLVVIGLTPTGRATVEALRMNRPLILVIRQEEVERGRHLP